MRVGRSDRCICAKQCLECGDIFRGSVKGISYVVCAKSKAVFAIKFKSLIIGSGGGGGDYVCTWEKGRHL